MNRRAPQRASPMCATGVRPRALSAGLPERDRSSKVAHPAQSRHRRVRPWPVSSPSRAAGPAPHPGVGVWPAAPARSRAHVYAPAVRIIAGSRKGHRIDAPKGDADAADVRLRARGRVQPDRPRRRRGRARPLRRLGRDGARGALARRRRAASSSSPTARPAARSTPTSTSCGSTRACSARTSSARSPPSAAPTTSSSATRPTTTTGHARLAPAPARASSRPTACSSTRPPRPTEPEIDGPRPSAPRASTGPHALRCSSCDHRDLPRLLRPRHERPRRRDHARGRRSSTASSSASSAARSTRRRLFPLDERVELVREARSAGVAERRGRRLQGARRRLRAPLGGDR